MPKDLRRFLRLLADKRPDELLMVDEEVDPDHGATGLVEALERQKRFPGVLFRNIKGSSIPCLINLGASFERMALALDDQPSLVAMEEELARREKKPLAPVEIDRKDAPVKEVIYTGDQVDLGMLPVLRHNELDAGRYVDGAGCIMIHLETGAYNMGLYRHQLHGKNRLGIMINPNNHGHYIRSEYEEAGKDCPVALAIGHHPWFTAAAVSRPEGPGKEIELAGAFLGEPVEMVRAETQDMLVPARAEIVIEGYVPHGERQYEGPFGEWPHYYYKQGPQPYIVVTAITTRKNPIYQSIFNAHPEHNIFGCAPRIGSLLHRVKAAVPGVKAVNLPYSGGCRSFCYVSMKKRSEGEPKQAAMAAFITDNNIRQVVVVDDDIDVF
ncbi:MAG: UbiD family decarboxylase, partial [Chloroflexi bacterium]|nr:UbiD family decarboxylase [Chloroflexota bacterium]